MMALGNALNDGFGAIARRALQAAREHGEAAVFIGKNGMAAAVAHYESGYRQALDSHAAFLAGVYRYEGGTWVRDHAPRAALDLKQVYRSIRHAGQAVSTVRQPAGERRGTDAGAVPAAGQTEEMRQAPDLGQCECDERAVCRAQPQRVLEVRERADTSQAGHTPELVVGGAQ